MRLGYESMPDAARKPAALLATVTVLAAGVGMGAPALAEGQPASSDATPSLSPRESDNHDSELWPSLGVGAFMLASCAGGMRLIGQIQRETQE